jgi:hypothetical protein
MRSFIIVFAVWCSSLRELSREKYTIMKACIRTAPRLVRTVSALPFDSISKRCGSFYRPGERQLKRETCLWTAGGRPERRADLACNVDKTYAKSSTLWI